MRIATTLAACLPALSAATVALGHDDHTPFNPTVVTGTTFRMTGSDGGDGGIGAGAVIGIVVAIGVVALLLGGGLGLSLRRR